MKAEIRNQVYIYISSVKSDISSRMIRNHNLRSKSRTFQSSVSDPSVRIAMYVEHKLEQNHHMNMRRYGEEKEEDAVPFLGAFSSPFSLSSASLSPSPSSPPPPRDP